MKTIKKEKVRLKAKRTFLKKGTCSRTFYYILDREFGHPQDDLETAVDPLAGGILQLGYQCGMIWGAALAVGGESYKKYGKSDKAISVAVNASSKVLASFENRAKSINCEDITNCDWSNKFSLAKYMVTGKMVNCFRLAGKWAPEAVDSAMEGLINYDSNNKEKPVSCTSIVAKKMEASEEEVYTVAGLAGGIGLSGGGCGVLATTIWLKTLKKVREGNWKYTLADTENRKILNKFYELSDYEIECSKICGKKFQSIEDHTDFINKGGCKQLIENLSQV